MHVVMAVSLDEGEVVVMRVAAMAQAQAHHEFARLRNFVHGFQESTAVTEHKGLARAVRPLRHHCDIFRRPSRTTLAANAPAWRHAVLEDLHRDDVVSGVDPTGVSGMSMLIMVVRMIGMRMMVTMITCVHAGCHFGALLIRPGSPQHPEGQTDDDDGGDKLEVGLKLFRSNALPQIHSAERDCPYNSGMRQCRRKPKHDGLSHGSPDGNDECGHHRLGMAGSSPCSAPRRIALGMNSQACAVLCWISSVKVGMAGPIDTWRFP